MLIWQLNGKQNVEQVTKKEIFDDVEFSKIKITKVLLDDFIFKAYEGKAKIDFPIIPGSFSVGIVSEFGDDGAYEFKKGSRVYVSALCNCGECYECITDNEEKCSNIRFSGRNCDGVLKEFAVVSNKQIFALPQTVSDKDALLLDVIAMGLSVIENIKINGGEHVVIIGSGIQSVILSQLISYYKGIPILVSDDKSIESLTENAGVYYSLKKTEKAKKQISDITGGRMATKVIYVCGTDISTECISEFASSNAIITLTGFDSYDISLNLNEVMNKQLKLFCVKNGYGNIESAINLVATKKIDTSFYSFKQIKFNEVGKYLAESEKKGFSPCYVNLMEL